MSFTIVQNDTTPPISSTLTDSGVPVDLRGVQQVKFHMQDKFERVVVTDDLQGNVNIVDAALGEVEYVFAPSDTAEVGRYEAEWQVEYDVGEIETFPTGSKIEINVVEEIE